MNIPDTTPWQLNSYLYERLEKRRCKSYAWYSYWVLKIYYADPCNNFYRVQRANPILLDYFPQSLHGSDNIVVIAFWILIVAKLQFYLFLIGLMQPMSFFLYRCNKRFYEHLHSSLDVSIIYVTFGSVSMKNLITVRILRRICWTLYSEHTMEIISFL